MDKREGTETESRANQCQQIIEFIREHGLITSAAAMQDLGIYRLASRIHDLRKRGWPIYDLWVTTKNRYGKVVKYKAYGLEVGGECPKK